MLIKLLSNKWLSLFCALVNSTFAFVAWDSGDYVFATLAYELAFICGWNFITAVKEDYYDC